MSRRKNVSEVTLSLVACAISFSGDVYRSVIAPTRGSSTFS
jgi:hypothetical protein